MPVKYRLNKRRADLPDVIARLLSGEAIAHTTENRRALRDAIYFRKYAADLTDADLERAKALHSAWRDEVSTCR